jgi:two-component system nitrate/nitrite response regulator NarL
MVLADRCAIMIEGMKQIFAHEQGFQVMATCCDERHVVGAVTTHQPDVLVLAISARKSEFAILEKLHGPRETGQLATRVVVVAEALGKEGVLRATRLGVTGVVLKDVPPSSLVRCVRKVHEGGTWVKEHLAGGVERMVPGEAASLELAPLLTTRELEVVRHVAAGRTNKQIAAQLRVSEGTIKTHLHRVYEKLDVRGRVGVTLYARDKCWL